MGSLVAWYEGGRENGMCVDIGKCGVHSVNMMPWMEGSGVRGWQFVVWAGGFRMTVLGLIEDELGMGDFWW